MDKHLIPEFWDASLSLPRLPETLMNAHEKSNPEGCWGLKDKEQSRKNFNECNNVWLQTPITFLQTLSPRSLTN